MTIFISIASYRDPELTPTIFDCIRKAKEPNRLRFGVCWQHGDEEKVPLLQAHPQIRLQAVNWRESRGVGWARAQAMNLYDGEDYYLQLDSHHRFEAGWDHHLLTCLQDTGASNPVVTAYCPPYDPARGALGPALPTQLNFHYFTDDGIPMFRPALPPSPRDPSAPVRARFASAHFLFASGSFVDRVPYDPEVYFHGEEITLAVRAYTWGYDLFHPPAVPIRHEYSREYRTKHWDDHVAKAGVLEEWHELDAKSKARVHRVLDGNDLGRYGCGPVRTVGQYEDYAGISFACRKVQDYTRAGREPPNPSLGAAWTDTVKLRSGVFEVPFDQLRRRGLSNGPWTIGLYAPNGDELFLIEVSANILAAASANDYDAIAIGYGFEASAVPARWALLTDGDAAIPTVISGTLG